ncbi:hypothetical protein GCM10023115_26830 [Pontixanthobacter gangjinensis]
MAVLGRSVEISPGCAGTLLEDVTVIDLEALVPQLFFATTEIVLDWLVVPGVLTVMVREFWPFVIIQLVGTVQIYSAALVISGIEYCKLVLFLQTFVGPVIDPVITGAGLLRLTEMDCELLSPQLLLAITERLPPVDPEFTVIVFVPWPLVILNPEVAVQV